MAIDEGFEVLRGVPNQVNCGFTGTHEHAPIVILRPLFRPKCVGSRFIEVGFLVEDEALNREQHLQQRGLLRVPPLAPAAGPGVKEAQADPAILVQVRVQPVPVRVVVDLGRVGRVIGREGDVEEEEAVVVGCAGGADDRRTEQVYTGLVDPNEDGVR